jgi:predicted Zn-dependent protease
LPEASTSEWDKALRLCHDQNSWVTLLHLAAQWKWVPESEDILQQIINNYPSDKWAEQALAQMLFGDGQTRSLMQLYSSETRRNPSDLVAKGDLALTALLLNAVEVKPAEMARELYHASPTNSTVAAAYALSLHLQRKPADAVKVMDALDPHDLENPSIAGYYGIFLQAAGNRAKAQHFLDLGSKAPMLPEERRLFDKARAGA